MSELPYTRQEMMAIAAGRELRDGELAIFGVGLSMLAGYFAQAHHAPRLRSMTEGGVYGATPVGGLPWGIECNRLSANATSFTHALDALGFLVASGRCDVGIIGAAQVDKFGNVNTTGIWQDGLGEHYRAPDTRLTGAGGGIDLVNRGMCLFHLGQVDAADGLYRRVNVLDTQISQRRHPQQQGR